ncbi:MAG TPA: hypothetical protein VKA02_03405 [Candidatus Acidoferrum sp.]|nr:hypothetical protein [Candidatus Acidoferrum sp.]
MSPNKTRKLIRLGNAAERLALQESTLRDWFLKRKNLDFVKAGRAVCVTEESLEAFIDRNLLPARERQERKPFKSETVEARSL